MRCKTSREIRNFADVDVIYVIGFRAAALYGTSSFVSVARRENGRPCQLMRAVP